MTDSFGTSASDQGGQETGTFGQSTDNTTTVTTDHQGIDSTEFEALRKRDAAAQEHIPKLESENNELRDRVAELESNLAKATTLDEALARMQNQGEDQPQGVDRADVAQIVQDVLGQHQTIAKQEDNWKSVQDTLINTFGDWTTADEKVMSRAAELDISIEDATSMARTNPKAFMQLFVPQGSSNPNAKPGSSTGAGEMGQRGAVITAGETRDKAWYNNLRRTNPTKYWSVDVQAQMRRDLFSD